MSFVPICNNCLTPINGGNQGFLLSCGHFICHGCCRGTQPSACPHCGNNARAAVLDHPPVEVREFLKVQTDFNPLMQLKAANDVVMFQLEHFRSAASQANKALHELRLIHSQEVGQREAAEEEARAWRKRAEVAEVANARNREGRRDVSGGSGGSPIGKLRQRFLGPRDRQRTTSGTAGALTATAYSSNLFESRPVGGGGGSGDDGDGGRGPPPQGKRVPAGQTASPLNGQSQSSRSTATTSSAVAPSSLDRSSEPQARQAGEARGQQLRRISSAVRHSPSAMAGESGGVLSSFPGPPPPARPLRLGSEGRGRSPDSLRLVAPGEGSARLNASSGRSNGISGRPQQQQQQQQRRGGAVTQRPETPGRPLRPAWQNGNGNGRNVSASTGATTRGEGQLVRRPQASQSGRETSSTLPEHQQQHQQRRPHRPTTFEANAGGASGGTSGGGGTGLFSSPSPPRNVRGGTGTPGSLGPLSSPRSPLLAVRPGAVKRPSSGSLPTPKRQGLAGAGGAQQGRAGTPMPTLRASSSSPQLRTAQLPFTPRSTTRPGSSQRPRSNGGSSASGGQRLGDGRHVSSVPPSLKASGLFGRRPR
ncbi:unnamed protein product [Pylaiella littoralis]